MTKRAFITGITGMVGSHLADFLLDQSCWGLYDLRRLCTQLVNNMKIKARKLMLPITADLQIPNSAKSKFATGSKFVIPLEQALNDLLEFWHDRVKHASILSPSEVRV